MVCKSWRVKFLFSLNIPRYMSFSPSWNLWSFTREVGQLNYSLRDNSRDGLSPNWTQGLLIQFFCYCLTQRFHRGRQRRDDGETLAEIWSTLPNVWQWRHGDSCDPEGDTSPGRDNGTNTPLSDNFTMAAEQKILQMKPPFKIKHNNWR